MHLKASALFMISAAGFSAGNASAFDVNGFRSGASLEAALKLLRERSDQVSEIGSASEPQRSFLGTSRGKDSSEAITVCRGQLNSYQYDVAGGMRTFVRMVQTEQAASGPGAGQALSRETSAGEWSTVNFKWSKDTDQKELGYSYISGEQVYVRYTAGTCQ